MIIEGIVIGLIVGFIRGGWLKSLSGLSKIKLIAGWIFPLLLILQLVVYRLQDKYEVIHRYSGYIYIAVYVCGIVFLYLNRKQPGFKWILAGVLMNFLVMAFNGGKMPVSPEAINAIDPSYLETVKNGDLGTKHILLLSSARLPFLGDIIPITKPYPLPQVASLGDLVMSMGAFIYLQFLMVDDKK